MAAGLASVRDGVAAVRAASGSGHGWMGAFPGTQRVELNINGQAAGPEVGRTTGRLAIGER